MSPVLPPHIPIEEELGDLKQADIDAMLKSPLLADCPPEAIQELVTLAVVRFVAHSGVLLQAGEANDSFFIVTEGQLASYKDAALTEVINRVPPGGCVGEMAFLADDVGATYVRAQWPTRVLSFKVDALREVIKKYPTMAVNLLDILSTRSKELSPNGAPGSGLNFLTIYNAVTGMHNRRWMLDVYKTELAKAYDVDRDVTLAIFDINQFFSVNQRLSRMSGDIILKQVAEIVRSSIKVDDLCAHLAIDQFVVLFKDDTVSQAARVADRICHLVGARLFSLPGGISARISLTASVVSSKKQDLDQILFRLLQGLAEVKSDDKRSLFVEPHAQDQDQPS